MERDPVCGKMLTDAEVDEVDAGTSQYATKKEYRDRWHYFCGLMCRMKFTGNPLAYVEQPEQKA
ncbi:MAG: hypothetical protein V3V35_04835 [Dehalococcoidia bacterium]